MKQKRRKIVTYNPSAVILSYIKWNKILGMALIALTAYPVAMTLTVRPFGTPSTVF
jgi:hypothetical protein